MGCYVVSLLFNSLVHYKGPGDESTGESGPPNCNLEFPGAFNALAVEDTKLPFRSVATCKWSGPFGYGRSSLVIQYGISEIGSKEAYVGEQHDSCFVVRGNEEYIQTSIPWVLDIQLNVNVRNCVTLCNINLG